MTFVNNKSGLYHLINQLNKSGIEVVVFGGWSAELLGIKKPWDHKDIDLLLIDNNFMQLTNYANKQKWKLVKSYEHKKAYTTDKILIEFFLVKETSNGYSTKFINRTNQIYKLIWPTPLYVRKDGYKISTNGALEKYRKEHGAIQAINDWS